MEDTMFKKIFLGLMITGLLIGGFATSVSAFGQNPPVCQTEQNPLDVLDMTAAELRAELNAGKTIQEIFEENGLDYEELSAQWLADHQACLDEAVAEGELTEEQAQLLQERLQERVEEGFLYNQFQQFGRDMRSAMGFRMDKLWDGGNGLVGEILEKLGISLDDLKERLQGGESLADIAEEADIDLNAIHEEQVAERSERIEQLLADGKISEDQAERMLDRLNTQLENPMPWSMFDRMQDRMDRPFDRSRDGGRPGGAGFSRGNSGGCW
jgi:polyhydroxyalkanoate synthesis regulator phasin